MKGQRLVLFRLKELLESSAGDPIWIPEGEKDVLTLVSLGFVATCGAMGAGKWMPDYAEFLRGRRVIVIADADQPGEEHAEAVARSLHGIAASVRVIRMPDAKDVTELVEAREAAEPDELRRALMSLADVPEWTPELPAQEALIAHMALMAHSPERKVEGAPWPSIPFDAFQGLAGEFALTIEPHTEADPVAILIQFLVAFGSVVGRTAHFVAEASRHHLNLFAVLVDQTSKGRKGTSWAHTEQNFRAVDEEWSRRRVLSGLSSGEGLIWAVRDPIIKREPVKKGKEIVGYQDLEADPGVSDKRLLVMESEFASVLTASSREKCTLSAVIRQAWDTGNLRTLTKNSPAQASNAHISIIGHVTKDELKRLLQTVDQPIHLVNTDPPYNVKVEPRSNNAIAAGLSSFEATESKRKTATHHQGLDLARHPGKSKPTGKKLRAKDRPLANDFVSDEEFDRLLLAWFGNISRVLLPGRALYCWGEYANCANYPPVLKACGLYFSQAIIWVKEHPVLTRKDFMGNHEWCFYCWREGAAHVYLGPNNATDVWSVKKVNPQSMVHLTEKPVELAVRAMQYSSRVGENVLDLFGGSGSTLIAAEQTGRKAFLMELDPLYADVIVSRYEKFSGQKAERA